MSNTNKVLQWINIIAFGLLMLGGLNFLLMGIFKFNMYDEIFGNSTMGRVFYLILGIATLVLLTSILCKAFLDKGEIRKNVAESLRGVATDVEAGTKSNRAGSPSASTAKKTPSRGSRTNRPSQRS